MIEIFRPQHLDPTYFFLSHQLGFEHHCLLAPTEQLSINDHENGNLYFPIDQVDALLDKSLLK